VIERQFTGSEILDLRKYEIVDQAAGLAYSNRQLASAADFHAQALQLAERLQVPELIDYSQQWLGTCYYQLGRLKDALATLGPILQTAIGGTSVHDRYNAFIHYIQAAQRLPVDLNTIQAAYDQIESFLRDVGHTDWRHELLVMLARLHIYRGMNDDALATAREAWALRALGQAAGYYGQVADFHLDSLVGICLTLRDPESAGRYLTLWEIQDDEMPVNREVRLSRCRSELARFEGRTMDAINLAKRAVFTAESTDYQETKFAAFITLIRSYLSAGQCESAHRVIKSLMKMRHSESKHDRYSIYLILGDYYLAKSCEFAGIAHGEKQFHLELNPPTKPCSRPDEVRSQLRRAERSYRLAQSLGSRIDEILRCTKHQEEVTARRRQVDLVRNYL
jgi:tetratricopeptide (TPR) repeat protein